MTAATIGYFAIKLQMIAPPIAQVPWPTPIGIGAFIGSGGDWESASRIIYLWYRSLLSILPIH